VSKSTRGFGIGRSSRSGTVTVIEQRVHRSARENARFAYIITVIVVGLAAMTIASDHMHPILAGLLGGLLGTLAGALVWTLVRVWPVLRILWWWTPEIGATIGLTYGWIALANATPALVTFAVLTPLIGIPAAIPAIRRRIVAVAWCVIVRHRLRVCFSQFIIANKSGSLPLILLARPTPVGERVWVYLRPGLSLSRLQARLDEIAVTCHATSALVELASHSKKAAYLRFDIKRREVLTADVTSPLPGLVKTDDDISAHSTTPVVVPMALDLPDVPAEPLTPATPVAAGMGRKPAPTKAASAADSADVDPWD
jgi:hypothetical protein